jgi:4-amino-4-deoxy-L-arabinose transferase-like glycosyltransferase
MWRAGSSTSLALDIALLLLLSALMLLIRLDHGSLDDWDEAIYAQMAREMLQADEWLVPHLGYEPFLHKPPLYIWFVASSFESLGISEFSARLPSALAGIALVVLTYAIGRTIYGRAAGLLAGVLLLTTSGFVWFARFATLDTTVTLFIYLAIAGYLRITHHRQSAYWYVVWAAVALAFLTKSAAVFVGVGPIAMDLALRGNVRTTLGSRHFWAGALIGALVLIPWHGYMYYRLGSEFIDQYVFVNVLNRTTSSVDGHIGDGFYYLRVLYAQFVPWVFLLPVVLGRALFRYRVSPPDEQLMIMLTLLPVVAFSAFDTKLPWYLASIYPAAIILIASFLVDVAQCRERTATVSIAIVTAFGVVAMVAVRPEHPLWVEPTGLPRTENLVTTFNRVSQSLPPSVSFELPGRLGSIALAAGIVLAVVVATVIGWCVPGTPQ